MIDQRQIEKWVKEGTITPQQAQKMIADISKASKETSSNKIIVALSTIGSIFVGIGAVLFVASNWNVMSSIEKVLVLVSSTFCVYYLGYYFAYQKNSYPKVGAALMFLGTLLFGATVFLLAQIYHINANHHTLVLVWLVCILPLVYAFRSLAIASLSALLSYIWLWLFAWKDWDSFFYFPSLFLIAGVLLFGIGGLHYLREELSEIARLYRIAGIKVAMFALFLLTFDDFCVYKSQAWMKMSTSGQITSVVVFLAVAAAVITTINLAFKIVKTDTLRLENTIAYGLIAMGAMVFFLPATTKFYGCLYAVIFNVVLAGIIFVLIYVGYNREDIKLVNIGMGYLTLLVIVRYFDFFWDLLPRSIFFIVGGIILVLGGASLEKKRRELKKSFGG